MYLRRLPTTNTKEMGENGTTKNCVSPFSAYKYRYFKQARTEERVLFEQDVQDLKTMQALHKRKQRSGSGVHRAYNGNGNLATVPPRAMTSAAAPLARPLQPRERRRPKLAPKKKSRLTLSRLPMQWPHRDLCKNRRGKVPKCCERSFKKKKKGVFLGSVPRARLRRLSGRGPASSPPPPSPPNDFFFFGEPLAFASPVSAFDCEVLWQRKVKRPNHTTPRCRK